MADEHNLTRSQIERLQAIMVCDRTPYYLPGEANAAGAIPPDGSRWQTPRELAESILRLAGHPIHGV